jgi:serine phosphatase RsbU (regulator of sigma subunit)
MAGRAFQLQEVVTAESDAGWTVWSPVRERAERIGVLEVSFERLPTDAGALCEDLGRLVGHLIRTADQYTDAVELCRRRQPMSLAAEVQWHLLLPPLAFGSPDVAVAGILEPAYDVGGDAFDYSLNGDILSFAMLDAMGHGLTSSLASALSLSAFRYGRLRGMDLEEVAHVVDEALIGQFQGETFVTGHLVRLDTATGELTWINAGHPDPLLIRGSTVVAEAHAAPCLPLGLGIQIQETGRLRLEPHDRLLFYSDGVVEARPSGGIQFGMDRLKSRIERHLADNLIPAEIIRRIVKEVLDHRGGPLADDASVIMIEWLPDNGR